MAQPEPADNSVLAALFQHNAWANLKLLDYCEALPAEQLDATAPGTYGAIRDTLLHIVGAEASYVQRVNGKRPDAPMKRGQFPGFAVLKQVAGWTSDELLQLARSARADTRVQEPLTGGATMGQYKLTSLIVQAINHSTEHRTQVSTILTGLGLEPPDMTGWQYMVDTGEYQEIATPES
ncbi:MAG TPA: DinB family protein [Chloroflexia bacterium]|nr:DinB family protein [Chloroflexia bacterium]